jgi:hypothetical protein
VGEKGFLLKIAVTGRTRHNFGARRYIRVDVKTSQDFGRERAVLGPNLLVRMDPWPFLGLIRNIT